MKKKYFSKLIAVVFLSLIFSPFNTCAADHIVEVEGISAILNGDIPQAKDGAIADAKLRAVEEAVGVIIDSKAVYQKDLLVESGFYARSSGFIKKYELLRERVDDSGLYRVRIRATVSDNLLEDELVKLLKKDRVLIVSASEAKADALSFETILSSKLIETGYMNIIIPEKSDTVIQFNPNQSAETGINREEARKIGIRYFADMIAFGSVKTGQAEKIRDNYFSCRASGFAQAFKTSDKKILASARKDAVRGYGMTSKRAEEDAVYNVNSQLADDLLKELTPDNMKEIKVVFYGISSFTDYRKYVNLLSSLRWVNGVEEDVNGYNKFKSVLKLIYSEKPGFIATALERTNELKVIKANDDVIEVEVVSGK